MRKFLGLVLTGMLLFCTVFSIVGCGEETEIVDDKKEIFGNAVLYDNAQDYAKEEFLQENITYGIQGQKDVPEEIVYIVKEQTDFDAMFTDFPTAIDFETEMVIVYFYTNAAMGCGCVMRELKKENEKLYIKFSHNLPDPNKPTGAPLTQGCLLVKMDKYDIDSVQVEMQYEHWN